MAEEKKRLIEEINRNFEDDWQYAQVIYPEENAKKEAFCGEGHKDAEKSYTNQKSAVDAALLHRAGGKAGTGESV